FFSLFIYILQVSVSEWAYLYLVSPCLYSDAGFLSAPISLFTLAGTVFVVSPTTIYSTAETSVGKPTSSARLLSAMYLVIITVNIPAAMDAIAAPDPLDLNAGSNPSNNGNDVGPSNAPIQFTIKPSTPPKRS